jgi:MFS family permease
MTSKSSSTSVTTTAAEIPDPRRWKALALLSLAQFVVILDTSIIGVALPTIQQYFGFSQTDLQWIFNAYVIVFGALLLLGGRLSDILGQRKIFIIGFMTLTIASVVAGFKFWSYSYCRSGSSRPGSSIYRSFCSLNGYESFWQQQVGDE